MIETTTRSYAGLSKEERIAKRQLMLMQTAMQLSDEIGWHNLSVERLCIVAKLNKRYFYESFIDLDALAGAVIDHVSLEVTQKIYQAMMNAQTVEAMAHSTINTFVNFVVDVPSRARLIFGDLSTNNAMAKHRKRLVKIMVNEITRNARQIHQPTNVSDTTIETCALFLIGGTGQVILDWLDTPDKMPIEQIINDITTLWLITGNGAAAHVKNMHSQ